MGFRFRKSVRLGRGLRINLSKSGASLSAGRSGATVNLSRRGVRTTDPPPASWSILMFRKEDQTWR